jgi:hypothetical protein
LYFFAVVVVFGAFFVIVMIDARVMIDSLMVVGWGQLNCSPELIRSKNGVKHDEMKRTTTQVRQ